MLFPIFVVFFSCVNLFSTVMHGNPTYTKWFHVPGLLLPLTMKAETNFTFATQRAIYPSLDSIDVRYPTTHMTAVLSGVRLVPVLIPYLLITIDWDSWTRSWISSDSDGLI